MPRTKKKAGPESPIIEATPDSPPMDTGVAIETPPGDPAEKNAIEGEAETSREVGLEEFTPEPPHDQNEAWTKRIPWDLVALNRVWGVYDAMGQFRAYTTPPLRAEGHNGDWFVDDGDFDTLISADVMPDFAEEFDWRTSLCKRPPVPASPFEETDPGDPGAGAATEAPNAGVTIPVIPAAPGAWGRFMTLMSEPGYMEGVFADRTGLDVAKNPKLLNAMGCAARLYMRQLARHIPNSFEHKTTPTLKTGYSTEFDLTNAVPKVTSKIRSTIKSEDEDEEVGRNPLQAEMELDTRTATEREVADMNAIIAAENEEMIRNGEVDLSPKPEPGGEPEVDAFAAVGGRPNTADEIRNAQETLKQLASEESAAYAAMIETDKDAERGVGNPVIETTDGAGEPEIKEELL